MAKPNYSFEKRQRELAKKAKKEEKKQQKAAAKAESEPEQNAGAPPAEDGPAQPD